MADLYKFLEQISRNNNRVWFAAHREEYDELRARWYADLQRLIDAMTLWMPAMASQTPSTCSYRFTRDTRFSSDKSPYKIFFSASLSPYGKKSPLAAYYLQLDCRNDENGLYAGLWMPDAPFLSKMRHAIVDNIEEFEEIVNAPAIAKNWPGWCAVANALKTAPKGWPKDHPQIDLLRLRDYGKYCPRSRDFFRDPQWPLMAAELFEQVKPFVDFINYSLTEE